MRQVCRLGLLIASVSLGGCVNSTFDSLSNQSTGCSASTIRVACTSPTPIKPVVAPVVVTPVVVTPVVTPTPTTVVNTGNNATLTTGDTTIILESSINQTPVGASAISQLFDSPLNRTIANGNMTSDQTINFNTKTATNSLWPISKTLTYRDYDTCINNGGVNTTTAGLCASGLGGTGLGGNYKAYRYLQFGVYDEELQVWAWNQSYATQYRDVSASGIDPQHQAWSFGGNYTTAANMPTTGKVNYAGQWTGTAKTANFDASLASVTVPLLDGTGAVVSVNGTPQTTTLLQTVAPTNNWRVNGTSALTADFGAGTLNGRLSSTNWQGVNVNKGLTDVDTIAARAYIAGCPGYQTTACNGNTPTGQRNWINAINYTYIPGSTGIDTGFMNTDVVLNGTIAKTPPATPPAVPPATTTNKENQVSGTAVMDPNYGWLTSTGSNPMYASFFGVVTAGKPKEVTGNFAFTAVTTNPNGGNAGLNNDRRGTIEMSGIFNGQ